MKIAYTHYFCIREVPEKEKKRRQKTYSELMDENFLILLKETDIQTKKLRELQIRWM